ncbi:hypothetical protein ZIOFF_017378 [Zingiber officinale]|uniref:V-ATPase proteolipid subunit C-like domain-containing protein n=1 Tax=Zingiber officinale TaxID=94328 RepID=A0A8J5H4V6_ZINOF|nr:hypothetical protein ZIOFF_017378 [Zingiber officinale]
MPIAVHWHRHRRIVDPVSQLFEGKSTIFLFRFHLRPKLDPCRHNLAHRTVLLQPRCALAPNHDRPISRLSDQRHHLCKRRSSAKRGGSQPWTLAAVTLLLDSGHCSSSVNPKVAKVAGAKSAIPGEEAKVRVVELQSASSDNEFFKIGSAAEALVLGQMVLDQDGKMRSKKINQKLSRELLACAIIRHDLSFSFVEYDGIRTWMKYINPDVACISRNTLVCDINRICLKEKEKLKANAQQPKLFVGMILILILAEALALYGLIVGIILSSRAGQSRADEESRRRGCDLHVLSPCFQGNGEMLFLEVCCCAFM